MELEKSENLDPSVESESPREKASFVSVGLLAIVLAPIVIITTLLAGSETSSKFTIDQPSEIRVLVSIKASEFLNFSERNVCDGSGEIAGLWRSEIQIRTSSWIRKTSLGQGTLNSEGACEYRLTIAPPSDFEGGDVIASAILPLGKAKDLVLNTGSKPSFKQIDLTYDLG